MTTVYREATSREVVLRSFDAQISGDGRTLDLRIVPFNVVQRVADPPDWQPYDEEWLPEAFDRQLEEAHRVKVWLNFEHGPSAADIIGRGLELRKEADALHGSFRLNKTAAADMAREYVEEGFLTGVSLEAIPLRSRITNSVTQRVRAHLDKVSLVRAGAYESAQVLALRQALLDEDAEEEKKPAIPDWARPQRLDPELAKRVGEHIAIPDRLKPIVPLEEQENQ